MEFPASPSEFASLREIIIKQAERYGSTCAIKWLNNSGRVESSLTYQSLRDLSFNLARYMKNQGVEAGDSVAIVQPLGPDFLVTFLACQVLRAVAIPVNPVSASKLTSLLSVMSELRPAMAMLHPDTEKALHEACTTHPDAAELLAVIHKKTRLGFRAVNVFDQSLGGTPAKDETWEGVEGEGTAYVQYTSGNTGKTKAVAISQRNVVAQLAMLSAATKSSGRRVLLSLVSTSFDYSSMVGCLWAISAGVESHLLPSSIMSTNPLIFLKILAETKATSAVIPEWVFGRVLSSWKATPAEKRPTEVWELSHCTEIYAFGGPIQVEAVKEFFNAFNATGLKLSAFRNVYTHVEHGGAIAISTASESLLLHDGRVSVGHALAGVTLKVVDPITSEELPEDFEGEIWIRSDSIAEGYWATTEQDDSGRTFNCSLKGGEPSYLRTGDLGVVVDGHLFVNGRLSDAVTIAGKNYFVADVEHFLRSYDGAEAVLALAHLPDHESGRQSVVLLVEIKGMLTTGMKEADKREYCSSIALRVTAIKGLRVTDVVLLEPNSLPVAETGKFARGKARTDFMASLLPGVIYKWSIHQPSTSKSIDTVGGARTPPTRTLTDPGHRVVADTIRALWRSILKTLVRDSDDFYQLGGSTAHVISLTFAIQKACQCPTLTATHLASNSVFSDYAVCVLEVLGSLSHAEEARRYAQAQWLRDQVVFPKSFEDFAPQSPTSRSSSGEVEQPGNVFLVGVLGVLGLSVLAEVLRTQATLSVYCLVDGESAEEGRLEVVGLLKGRGLWQAQWAGRIIPVVQTATGDRFGLSDAAFSSLAEDIKIVIVCPEASGVLQSYSAAENQNVWATRESIRLALSKRQGVPATVHLVSTLDVFDSPGAQDYAQEIEVTQPPLFAPNPGYSQTKWAAEQLVLKASRDFGLPASIYRLGSMLGHPTSQGTSLQGNVPLNSILENIARLGAVPKSLLDMKQNVVTVDFAARVVVSGSTAPISSKQVGIYHLTNGPQYPLRRAINVFQSETGRPIKIMDNQDWFTLAERSLPTNASSATESSASPEFLAWASAYLPRSRSERERIMSLTGMDVSCIQLQDRLRRLIVGSGLPRSYHSLLDEVRSPNLEDIDKALVLAVKGGPKTRLTSAVVKRRQGVMQTGLQNWIMNTPSLAFLSVFLYAILGTS